MSAELLPLLLLGFGLGMVHALDADHIMAVSILSNQKPGLRATLFHSAHWAAGHGTVLLLSGIALFGLGIAIPEGLQHVAEMSVGILLITLGLMCFFELRRDRLTLEPHRHGELVHSHWHDDNHKHAVAPRHKPVFVGVLHGLAGSSPALALIPAVAQGQLLQAVLYLGLFSVGVMLSMMIFGLGLGHLQRLLCAHYRWAFQLCRQLLAYSSIALGSYWVFQGI